MERLALLLFVGGVVAGAYGIFNSDNPLLKKRTQLFRKYGLIALVAGVILGAFNDHMIKNSRMLGLVLLVVMGIAVWRALVTKSDIHRWCYLLLAYVCLATGLSMTHLFNAVA